ncbi:phosphonate metabolism protein/1,5-bisphosphokinase (PRPP-forming) PhnN [Marinobacter zhanjiangensis]|uniref:Ribose 1,5-bisphosphate phosphokinase PhnN n=1 Tax=Marinobacter zhanjiangensis TaxID=578215 RepID=A0ABQ3AZ84_9GAMM|nr:phosphonate metabolism protein/1,5-bisphosphokinase (PRPP-forming) PhnN [Marinobacter zhanjiangensis]GGY68931.1 ribose 1,5-bisphosphate phosphokinase PhnN [Marinobacter zhanjiangensis]
MTTGTRQDRGRLFYLMGPSGAGKDSLLDACRNQRVSGQRLRTAPRYITRHEGAGGEDHIAVTPGDFHQQLEHGRFALHWLANGRHYGIGIEVDRWLAAGDVVLMNGSRAHLEQALGRYRELLVPVLICVDPEKQRQRLVDRGRETAAEIEARVERARRLQSELESRFVTIHNNGTLSGATEQLLAIIRDHLPERLSRHQN